MLLQTRTLRPVRKPRPGVSRPVAIVAGSLVLGALSLMLPSAPTYDPFAWIIWGREITQLDLNTVEGPSWKPLPVILTTLTAPLGEASPFIWVAVARAGAIAGVVLAWMVAARLAGHAAGFAAAAALALMPWTVRHAGLANSEGLMVALVLGAVLTHLHGRRGWAFALGVGASLLRPEVWPFLGLYVLWLLYEDRTRLRWVAGGLATLPVLWLGPELWGSGNAFRASDRAQTPNPDSPAFADNPALEVIGNAIDLVTIPAVAGTAVAAALAAAALVVHRRGGDRAALTVRLPAAGAALAALVLAAGAAAWIGLVAVMTSHGFSGNSRYLIVPAAMLLLLGAVGIVWTVAALARPLLDHAALAAGVAVAVGVALALQHVDLLDRTFRSVDYQARLYHDLGTLIEEGGGAERLLACGVPVTGDFLVPQVAWRLGIHLGEVELEPGDFDRAVVFHVRTVEYSGIEPPVREARPHVLARAGHWMLSADCEPVR